jgi:hypothetical protein
MNTRLHNRVIVGDVRRVLPRLPTASIDCVITSPPYWNLRDYQAQEQIGLETSVTGWVGELRAVLHEVARVLTPTGGLWINLADSYSRDYRHGAAPKSLVLAPERLALALLDDGWTIRNKVVWAKTNPMPTSVRDRLSCTWEVMYFAVRSRRYYFDLDAIRVPHRSTRSRASAAAARRAANSRKPAWSGPLAGSNSGLDRLKARGVVGHPLGKNPGDVWQLATSRGPGKHHATFLPDFARRPLLASCPERVCVQCTTAWRRQPVQRRLGHLTVVGNLVPDCTCAAPWRPGRVLDPFIGSGTTGLVAEAHGRDWLGIELNSKFVAMAEARIAAARGQPEERAA